MTGSAGVCIHLYLSNPGGGTEENPWIDREVMGVGSMI